MGHLASHNHKLLFLSYGRESTAAAEDLVARYNLEAKYGYTYGEDYVIFPFLAGEESAMTAGAADLFAAYTTDNRGTLLTALPLLETVKSMNDVDLVIFQSHIITIPHMYVRQFATAYGVRSISMGGYATVAPYYGTYVFGAMDRSAEYEIYVGLPGEEVGKMDMANLENILMVSLILIGLVHSLITRGAAVQISPKTGGATG
jgi:hypothetical protein